MPQSALEPIVRAIEAGEPLGRRTPLNPHPHSIRKTPRVTPVSEPIELGDEARRVVSAATALAQSRGGSEVAPADLARAIMTETDDLAARLLRQHRTEGS